MDREKMNENIDQIERDLEVRAKELEDEGQPLYAMRLRQRTRYDIEMMRQIGFCTGIENYSRYFDGRKPGDAPYSLLDYFPKDFLMFIDESHVTVPQIRAMYNGDRARKKAWSIMASACPAPMTTALCCLRSSAPGRTRPSMSAPPLRPMSWG